mgnify:CR=1 FL=1
MTTVTVSNAGPLLVLSKLNLLHLLRQCYGTVLIPQAVYVETVVEGLRLGYTDAHVLRAFLEQAQWLPVTVAVPADIAALPLDRGEQESLALARAHNALLLMDEERGRAVARSFDLPVRGTLGILIGAYRWELITAEQLRFYFEQIAQRVDVWISPALCKRLLAEVLGPG